MKQLTAALCVCCRQVSLVTSAHVPITLCWALINEAALKTAPRLILCARRHSSVFHSSGDATLKTIVAMAVTNRPVVVRSHANQANTNVQMATVSQAVTIVMEQINVVTEAMRSPVRTLSVSKRNSNAAVRRIRRRSASMRFDDVTVLLIAPTKMMKRIAR